MLIEISAPLQKGTTQECVFGTAVEWDINIPYWSTQFKSRLLCFPLNFLLTHIRRSSRWWPRSLGPIMEFQASGSVLIQPWLL